MRVVLLIIIGAFLLGVGYLQYSYVLNFTNNEGTILLERNLFVEIPYQGSKLLTGIDPRAYSMLFYATFSATLSILFIRVYFHDVKWTILTIKLYMGAYILSILILGLLYLISYPEAGISIFQKAKNALSSSFIICFLIPLYTYFSKNTSK